MSDLKKNITILAIESSCDETAASVVVNGRRVLSNVISSQIDIHTLYGGVVPEIASRKHTERVTQVIRESLQEAGRTLEEMDAIAVTYGPGLVGPLLIGVSAAKGLSFATGIPLIGVHHIEGHISANYIADPSLEPPFACLVVSGGHTHLVLVRDYGVYEPLTRLPVRSAWDTPAAPRSTRPPGRETRMPLSFPAERLRVPAMISVSAV